MIARFGTSGFSYPEWRGSFYPPGLPTANMLGSYAERLSTVELNNSFYRMPRLAQVDTWANSVPSGFRFALKASRRITHIKKLRDTSDALLALLRVCHGFREQQGPLLFQLPPFLRKDMGLLREFLSQLPGSVRAAFEFRHHSWFSEDVYQALSDGNAALCGGDADDPKQCPPLLRTSAHCYLRLRRSSYAAKDLEDWKQRLLQEDFAEVYGYFKHEELGPSLAATMNAIFENSDKS